MQIKWEGLSKAILTSSGSNKKLNIAVSMESHDNHEIKFEYMKKFFTTGNKYSQEKVQRQLISDYMTRLENKD